MKLFSFLNRDLIISIECGNLGCVRQYPYPLPLSLCLSIFYFWSSTDSSFLDLGAKFLRRLDLWLDGTPWRRKIALRRQTCRGNTHYIFYWSIQFLHVYSEQSNIFKFFEVNLYWGFRSLVWAIRCYYLLLLRFHH